MSLEPRFAHLRSGQVVLLILGTCWALLSAFFEGLCLRDRPSLEHGECKRLALHHTAQRKLGQDLDPECRLWVSRSCPPGCLFLLQSVMGSHRTNTEILAHGAGRLPLEHG